jgi:uncharacterized membrane protein
MRPIPILLWLAYPLVILFGLQWMPPRYVAIILALVVVLRSRSDAARLLAGLSRVNLAVIIGLLAFIGATAVSDSELLLRFYPAAMNLGMLLLFGLSLFYPPSMVERFARLGTPDLNQQGVCYTRRVTQVWCVFFVANGAISVFTALYASRETWALYNGFIAYILMGILFAGEWFVRHYFLARTAE